MLVKDWRGVAEDMSIAEAIKYEISATYSDRGQLEDIEIKLELLIQMFASLVEHVGEPAAVKLLTEHGRHRTPVKGK